MPFLNIKWILKTVTCREQKKRTKLPEISSQLQTLYLKLSLNEPNYG